MYRLITALVFGSLIFPTSVLSNEEKYCYSEKELVEMADAFLQARNTTVRNSISNKDEWIEFLMNTAVKASEFKGYIAALMDSSQEYRDCRSKHSVNDIVYRTAILIKDNPNENLPAVSKAVLSLTFACDDSRWVRKERNNSQPTK